MHLHSAPPTLLVPVLFPKFPWNFELWKMPRTGNVASTKPAELAKQEEHLEFDDPDEVDEEEEVEYEEIEEEVEYEDVEEDEETEAACEVDAKHDSKMVDVDQKGEDETERHAELLALPPHGSEVYVGGISSDVSSEDLKKLCESIGEVVEVRMRGKGDNRLYAFVNFRTEELALKAIQKLNDKDLKGKKIKFSSSQAKNKLFIGNVPKNWTQDDFKNVVERVGPGVLEVTLVKVPQSNCNKGYGFIEYYNQACAEYAKQKMSTPEFKLDTNAPTVSWADPKNCGEAASTPQVKSLYVKNLPKTVTQDQLKKLFEHLGEITKVVLPPAKSGHENRYGFVHFKERSVAMKALKNTERYELDGQLLDCSLAKPPADKKDDKVSVPTAKGGPLLPVPSPTAKGGPLLPAPSYTPLGYGLLGAYNPLGNGLVGAYNPLGNGLVGAYNPLGNGLVGAYNPLGNGVAGTYNSLVNGLASACGVHPARATQPLLYAPGSTMIPMVLPDGRLGYISQPARQQPVPVPATSPPPLQVSRRSGGGSSSGGSSSGGKQQRGGDRGSTSSSNNSRRGRHRPY